MKASKWVAAWLMVALASVLLMCVPALASPGYLDFEDGENWSPVLAVYGITFATEEGDDLVYADSRSSDWRINGPSNPDQEYWVGGYVGVVSPFSTVARLSFDAPVSDFRVGYSSYFDFVVQAFDADNQLIDAIVGSANSRTNNGSGLSYLDLSGPDIAYVRMFAQQGQFTAPGYWLIDDVTITRPEAVVPEAPAVLLAGMAMLAPLGRTLRRYIGR